MARSEASAFIAPVTSVRVLHLLPESRLTNSAAIARTSPAPAESAASAPAA